MSRKKIIIFSGGQSGTDRAALDYALKNRMKCGGWCPAGRWAEDGRIADHYPLTETESPETEERTRKNVDHSDATLIICLENPDRGTSYARKYAKDSVKPVYLIRKQEPINKSEFHLWLDINKVHTLNVAGPRESSEPGVYKFTLETMKILFG